MTFIEIALLIIAYTLLTITLFLQFVCYKRNLETLETIAFTISLLILILSLTITPFVDTDAALKPTNVYVLLAMVLVGLTTPLNVLKERRYEINPVWRKILIAISGALFLATIILHLMVMLSHWQYVVMSFLGLSVILSMVMIRMTRPEKRILHREQTEQIFAIAFLILVPLSLVANYFLPGPEELKMGFTIPLVFILLAGNKCVEDVQRLSLLNPKIEVKEQSFVNYAFTDREKEIALLLTGGKTYKEIGEQLHISLPTVKTHTSNIYRKAGAKNRAEFMVLVIS